MRYILIIMLLSFFIKIKGQNVGIGTSVPGSRLTVNGSFAAVYRSISGDAAILPNDFYVVWNGTSNGTVTLPVLETGNNNYKGRLYYIKNNSLSQLLTVDGSGNEQIDIVGGTGWGVPNLVLQSGESIMLVNTGNTLPSRISWEVVNHGFSNPGVNFWKTGGNTGTSVLNNYLGTSDAQDLSVRTNGTEKLRITQDGNIGIGTTTPLHRLQVMDASTTSAALISVVQPGLIANQATYIKLGRSVSVSPLISNNAADILFRYIGDQDIRNYLGFGFHGNTEKMVVRADGRVGIGTTSPGYQLHVNDGITVGDAVLFSSMQPSLSSGSTTYMKFGRSLNNNETGNIGFHYESSNPSYIGFSFQNFPADKMVIRTDGRVGIGTTSPGYQLHVNDGTTAGDAVLFSSMQPNLLSGSTTYMKFGRSLNNNETGNIGFHYESSNPSYIGFSFQNFPADKMVIRTDGNVGIGTVAPGSKLTVDGSFGAAYVPQTTNYTMTANDFYVVWKDEGNNGTITLPVASNINNYKGRLYLIKNNSLTRTLTIRAATTESIDIVGGDPSSSVLLNSGEILNLISTGGPTGGITWEVVSHSVSSIPVAVPSATPWYVNGNSGTVGGSNFLGTTDNQALVFKTNNVEAARITTSKNLNFPDQTNSSSSQGIITKNGIPFIHNTRGTHATARINNTALGLYALNLSTTGDSNTAVGTRALANIGFGFNNTAVGQAAMEFSIGGAQANSAFGSGAMKYNTNGAGNTAIGGLTLQHNNGGSHNTAVGHEALRFTVNSTSNVAVGAYAGVNSTASQCVYIGRYAGHNNNISDRLIIDNQNEPDIFPLIEGNFSTFSNGGLGPRSVRIHNDLTVQGYLTVVLDQTVGGRFRANLEIAGSYLAGTGTASLSCDNSGNIIRTPSDARLKTNAHPISHALDKVKNMQGYIYQFIDQQRFGSNMQMGFMAQELEKIVPEAVNNGGEYKSVNYQMLTALLAEAIKEQQTQIDILKQENKELKNTVNKIVYSMQ